MNTNFLKENRNSSDSPHLTRNQRKNIIKSKLSTELFYFKINFFFFMAYFVSPISTGLFCRSYFDWPILVWAYFDWPILSGPILASAPKTS